MAKKSKKIDEIKFPSNKELLKEAKSDIERSIKEETNNPVIDYSNMENNISEKNSINKIKKLSPINKIKWVIEKHDSYITTINQVFRCDLLGGTSYMERICFVYYMQQLVILLENYKIEFSKEMVAYLRKDNQVDLLNILNTLNYIPSKYLESL